MISTASPDYWRVHRLNGGRVLLKYCGPSSGRLKCPLQSTNKRFLLNTLRSTEPHKHSPETGDGAGAGAAAARGRSRSGSLDRQRDRSRSPLRDHTSKGGHGDHKHHQRDSWNNRDKRRAGDRERSSRRKDNREWRHGRDTRSKDWTKNVQKRNTASFTRTTPSTGRRAAPKLLSGQLTWLETLICWTALKTLSFCRCWIQVFFFHFSFSRFTPFTWFLWDVCNVCSWSRNKDAHE